MNKKILIFSSIAIAIILLIWIGKSKSKSAMKVSVCSPQKRSITQTVSANGKIHPETELLISSDVSGEIIDIYVQEGDSVKTGQLLAKIKPDLYITAVDRANANVSSSQSSQKLDEVALNQAKEKLDDAQANYDRQFSLFQKQAISKVELERALMALNMAKAELKASQERKAASTYTIQNAKAGLKEAQQNLNRTIIYAPSDGVVSKINNKKGERVVGTAQMQGTEMMRISNFRSIEVRVDINENDILKITKGDSANVEIEAYGNRIFKGIVSHIAKSSKTSVQAMANDAITTFEVKIRLLPSSYSDLIVGSESPFMPGFSASVEIETEKSFDVLALPIEVVSTRKPKVEAKNSKIATVASEVVFIYQNGKVKQQEVKTGKQDNEFIEIISGISSKDEIISGPYDAISIFLEDGMSVSKEAKK